MPRRRPSARRWSARLPKASEGQEFTLLVARRLPSGEVVVIGEVPDDVALLERAAKKLIG